MSAIAVERRRKELAVRASMLRQQLVNADRWDPEESADQALRVRQAWATLAIAEMLAELF